MVVVSCVAAGFGGPGNAWSALAHVSRVVMSEGQWSFPIEFHALHRLLGSSAGGTFVRASAIRLRIRILILLLILIHMLISDSYS